ncbi:anti-repressor SinI family protein [Neobacillus sp. FSL H8-0543]
MYAEVETHEERLDPEWVELMLLAKEIGLTLEEVRKFICQS